MKADTPLVSIVIPVYNVESFLSECVESVLGQTYQTIEVILVNDGSTDNSGKACKQYALSDTRIKFINQRNQGVSSARNKGIDVASGDYITFIDADDAVHRDYIKNLAQDMLVYNATAVTTPVKDVVRPSPRMLKANIQNMDLIPLSVTEGLLELYRGTLEGTRNGVQMFNLYLLKKHGIRYDENMAIGEDFDFFARALLVSNKLVVDRREMYFYRANPSSVMMQDFNIKHFNAIKNVEKVGRSMQKEIPGLKKAIDTMLFSDSVYYGAKMVGSQKQWPNEHREILQCIRDNRTMVLTNHHAKKNTRIKAILVTIFGANLGLIVIKRLIRW